jgi:hypothetical protein
MRDKLHSILITASFTATGSKSLGLTWLSQLPESQDFFGSLSRSFVLWSSTGQAPPLGKRP